jgi:hypothetical protein
VRQTGSVGNEEGAAVAVDADGNAYITGYTTGDFGAINVRGYDIFLAKYGPPPCTSIADIAGGKGDVGADGTVDGADFIAFINSFATANPAVDPLADLNGDGLINDTDFILFINAFAVGC